MTNIKETLSVDVLFSGGGETGALMRARDWTKSKLGPVDLWPNSLISALSICLNCQFPIAIYWGVEKLLFYNDAWRPIVGNKHPEAFASPARQVWPEIWDVIGPLFESVDKTGHGKFNSNQLLLMNRFGYTEECYFDFTFSPIKEPGGGVGGVFNAVLETTFRVLEVRRTATLKELASRTFSTNIAEESCRFAAEAFNENPADIPFSLIYLTGKQTDTVGQLELIASSGIGKKEQKIINEMLEKAILPRLIKNCQPEVLDELSSQVGFVKGEKWPDRIETAYILPLLRSGHHGRSLIGAIVFGISPKRAMDQEYKNFLDQAAVHLSTGVLNALAYEDEHKRAEALAEIDRTKTAFFSNVSHEFRTPLTLMLGPLEETLADTKESLGPQQRQRQEQIYRNALRLLKLVNSLLDFSRIEAGRLNALFQPVDIATLTTEITSIFRSAIENAGLRLTVDSRSVEEPVYVDPDMWEKIILNLLSNAFKFTFEGEINVQLTRQNEDICLKVRDTGTGIPPSELPHLFKRFYRVDGAIGRTYEGSGIGLALVKELVELHGGTIGVESRQGHGTTFTVSIPLGKSHLPEDQISTAQIITQRDTSRNAFVEEARRWLSDKPENGHTLVSEQSVSTPGKTPTAHTPGLKVRRVLLADDNTDMREYVSRILSDAGFEVEAVADGQAALAAAVQNKPDVVLSDIMMPGMDGIELLNGLRSDERLREIPIILLSARAGEESRIEGVEAGADDYLIKPFSARELVARVSAHAKMSLTRQEIKQAIKYRTDLLEAILTHAPGGIYLVDSNFKIAAANPIAQSIFGKIPGGVIGKDFAEMMRILWDRSYAEEVISIFRNTLETGESYFTAERAEHRADRNLIEYYEWRVDQVKLEDGSKGVVCYFQDISSKVRVREALRDADRRKDEFLATLAHELRGPLAPICNMLEIIRRTGNNNSEVINASDVMDRQIFHMTRLIEDLMDISRISRGKIELKKKHILLAPVINEAVASIRQVYPGHRLTVRLPENPVIIYADETRLIQIILNLLSNACKFSETPGNIQISVSMEGEQALIRVRDDGIGMDSGHLTNIFELFTQLDTSLERSQSGLGIGLTMVKRLVELHEGTVVAKSKGIGQGSEFTVRLPVEKGTLSDVGEITYKADKPELLHRILIVDDQQDNADSLAKILGRLGHTTTAVYDGLEAIAVAEKFHPDVIFLDIGMPKISGFNTCRRIREEPWGKDIMIVALTGWGQEEDRRKTREAGFNHHLVKPVSLPELTELLRNLPSKDKIGEHVKKGR